MRAPDGRLYRLDPEARSSTLVEDSGGLAPSWGPARHLEADADAKSSVIYIDPGADADSSVIYIDPGEDADSSVIYIDPGVGAGASTFHIDPGK